jgi:hypothetical protein
MSNIDEPELGDDPKNKTDECETSPYVFNDQDNVPDYIFGVIWGLMWAALTFMAGMIAWTMKHSLIPSWPFPICVVVGIFASVTLFFLIFTGGELRVEYAPPVTAMALMISCGMWFWGS